MGDVVNLKRIRKRAAREQASKQADINRAKFGRTKSEREDAQRQAQTASRMLDHHRLPQDDS